MKTSEEKAGGEEEQAAPVTSHHHLFSVLFFASPRNSNGIQLPPEDLDWYLLLFTSVTTYLRRQLSFLSVV